MDVMQLLKYQYQYNKVYHQWCDSINVDIRAIKKIEDIPFLPISFFKTHEVVCGEFEPELIFESSGTTTTVNSRHLVKSARLYEQSFLKGFERIYGNIKDYYILGLLPNYLERGNSSLVKMVDGLITFSHHVESGFYLYNLGELSDVLQDLEARKKKTLLFGVTFALLDFAEKYPMRLRNTTIMDTGGMKGRRQEMTRAEVHKILKNRLSVSKIHSEYGMTELLSQAYSGSLGRYNCPPWMRVLLRDETDPSLLYKRGRGLINVIDLANVYSCAFIATDDVGMINEHWFEVWGRRDNSDLRGCSLLAV